MVIGFFVCTGFIAMIYFLHQDFIRRRDKTYRILREAKKELRRITEDRDIE